MTILILTITISIVCVIAVFKKAYDTVFHEHNTENYYDYY